MWFALALLLAQSTDFVTNGLKSLDAKQYDAAVESFTKAVAADPKDYSAHFHLALAYSLVGKNAEAIPQYKATLELKPGLYEAEINLGICLLRVKDPAAALTPLREAAAQKPKEFQPAFYVARALLDTKQLPEAEAGYVTALSLNQSSAAAEEGLAQALALQGKRSEADPHFRKAASLDPSYRDSILQLASLYEENNQAAEAMAIYREFPDNPGALEHLSHLLMETGHTEDAIPSLEAVVAKSPTAANRVELAQAYLDTKHPEKANPLLAQAVASEPGDYQLRMFYAKVLRDQRKYAESAPQFLAASRIKPDVPQPWSELAAVFTIAAQYPEALAALDHVRALGAETTGHYYFRAVALDHLHQVKDALANYNKFLEMSQEKSPDEEFIARQRIRVLEKELGNRK
ncbi:MAG: tetratricopeptide repeat protein [Bryobacteraceae bacterium]|jgi:tetratricopeptide (TPR) repeat protein